MRLRELRESRGLSQRTIADYLGCSTVVYSRYETGAREPSIDVLIRLAEYYGSSVDYLIGRNVSSPLPSISSEETRLLAAYRQADAIYRSVALEMLETHPANPSASNLA